MEEEGDRKDGRREGGKGKGGRGKGCNGEKGNGPPVKMSSPKVPDWASGVWIDRCMSFALPWI